MKPATEAAAFIGGFVAGEGSFVRSGRRFTFAVGLAAADRGVCETLHGFFGRGSVTSAARRRPHYDDEVTFAIQSLRDHMDVTIPFMDDHLPESYKRVQYLGWRAELVEYWEERARRVRSCAVQGCEAPRRAYGLCRRHLYRYRGE